MKKFKHVFGPEKYSMWQVVVLRTPIRSGVNFPSPQDAACSCQFFKNYLYSEFKISLEESLDCETHSSLSYRLNVNLSDSLSVFNALPESAKSFIEANRAELDAHRDSQPDEPDYIKVRRHAPSMANPATCEWVSACEQASADKVAFDAINHPYFQSLYIAASKHQHETIPPLRRAVKMLANAVNPKLVAWRTETEAFIAHVEEAQKYIEEFSARLAQQETDVRSALSKLERPSLT